MSGSANGSGPSRRRLAGAWLACCLLGPLLALAATWLPLWRAYHVDHQPVSPAQLELLRQRPAADTLARLAQARWTEAGPGDPAQRRHEADDALAGMLRLPGLPPVRFHHHTDRDLLTHPNGRVQLLAAAMQPAEQLLRAYEDGGERRYFEAALAATLEWADFDAGRWLPLGLVWNDHALAARLIYLARFWAVYRADPDFDPADGRRLLAFVYRTAERLARPSLYAARTNHGVMQDLALLHAAIAFPDLPGTRGRLQTALARLRQHLGYYVSPGGLVLEHSASYQELGVELLRSLQLYLALLQAPDPHWQSLASAARCLLADLARPDDSLPFYGDSHGRLVVPGMAAELRSALAGACRQQALRIDSEFGYLLANDGRGSEQLFVAWTNFPTRSHKHADELSAYLWHAGIDWWGASGYWPYSDPQRSAAIGWRGTNAPHLLGEAADSRRKAQLLASAVDGQRLFVELARSTGAGRLHRQLLRPAPGIWLVLDSSAIASGGPAAEVLWSLGPGLVARRRTADLWRAQAPARAPAMELGFAGAASGVQLATGDREPFAAMTALPDGRIVSNRYWPVALAAGQWTLAAWVATDGGADRLLKPPVVDWRDERHWSIRLALRDGDALIARDGDTLQLQGFAAAPGALTLRPAAPARGQLTAAVAAYRQARASHPLFRDLLHYRWRTTAALAGIALLQWPLWLWLYRRTSPAWLQAIALPAALIGWCLLSAWLYFVYLR